MRSLLRKIGFELLLVLVGHFLYTSYIKTSDYCIRSDGKGYYDYLPATFIYKDLNFGFRANVYENVEQNFNHNVESNGKTVNKYTCGLAVLWTPFFVAADEWVKNGSAIKHDGFSLPYHFAVYCAALFYLLAGLYFLKKLLLHFTADLVSIRLVQVLILFATNLYIFSFYEAAFSHVYSFCFITLFCYSYLQFIKTEKVKYLYSFFICLALIMLIRPFNILVVLFLPFLSGGFKPCWNLLLQQIKPLKRHFVFALVCFLLVVSLQPVIWYIQAGSLLPWTYSQETFHFNDPALWQTLFGFRKGLFIYTPVLLFSLVAFIPLIKKNKLAALWLAIAFFVLHYCMASWQTWWYGGGFGLRPYIDFYALFAILFAMLFTWLRSKLVLVGVALVIGVFSVVNIIQTYQYTHYILLLDEMRYDDYTDVFLKTNPKYENFLIYKRVLAEMQTHKVKQEVLSEKTLTELTEGEWKVVPPFTINLNAGEHLFLINAELENVVNNESVLFVSITDTLNTPLHYEQKQLFHFTLGKEGKRQVSYYIRWKNPDDAIKKLNFGFVNLMNKVKVNTITIKELEL